LVDHNKRWPLAPGAHTLASAVDDWRLRVEFTSGTRPCFDSVNSYEHVLASVVSDMPDGDVVSQGGTTVSLLNRACEILRVSVVGDAATQSCTASVQGWNPTTCASGAYDPTLHFYRVTADVPNFQPGEMHTISMHVRDWVDPYVRGDVLWGDNADLPPFDSTTLTLDGVLFKGGLPVGVPSYMFTAYASYLQSYILYTDNFVSEFLWTASGPD
jgi:hypothetical protein